MKVSSTNAVSDEIELQDLIVANLDAKPSKREEYAKKQKQNGSKRNLVVLEKLSRSMSSLLGSNDRETKKAEDTSDNRKKEKGSSRRNLLSSLKGKMRSEPDVFAMEMDRVPTSRQRGTLKKSQSSRNMAPQTILQMLEISDTFDASELWQQLKDGEPIP